MDLTQTNLLPTLFILLIPIFLLITLQKLSKSSKNLPPGPKPWPVIGNLHQMGTNPHISLAKLAQTHGPLMSMQLGTKVLIVGSSPAAAGEILKTHDAVLSGRCLPKAARADLQKYSLAWAPDCSDHWKTLRALCKNHLFSAKVIENQTLLRHKKVLEMVDFLGSKQGEVVKIGEVVFTTNFNMLSNVFFSEDFISFDGGRRSDELKGWFWKLMELGAAPNVCDFYPIFEGLDPQGLKRKFGEVTNEVLGVFQSSIRERRERRQGVEPERDFLDAMLNYGFSDIQIQILALELFAAGAGTTSSTIEWVMSEFIKNKQALSKVCKELEEISGTSEAQISQLTYLNACVKETLRLHPPVPFLIPHYALETCDIMNYTIPKGSQVIVNLWAVGRDPTSWEDPLSFKPERFLDSKVDFRGQDLELLPFGAGRKMCPGLPLVTKQVPLILAALLRNFEWFLPKDEDPSRLDMGEKFGVTLEKENPLQLIPKLRVRC